jgi:hypothetical protein
MSNNIDYSNMEEKNEQTLLDIKNLQKIEQNLYISLETNANNNTLTDEEKSQIINKINEISQMRINLFDTLKDTYSFFKTNVASSRITLDEQIVALEIVENELAQAKLRLQMLQDEKTNKLRQVEINTFYGKRYDSHTDVMKIIVMMCIPILILGLILNTGILPETIGLALIALVIAIGVIAIGYKLLDIIKRDNMNYDEYDWGFNEKDAPKDDIDTGLIINPWTTPTLPKCYTNDYIISQNTNSVGNDLTGSLIANSSVNNCKTTCNSNSLCSGFIFNNNNSCLLKGSLVKTAPTISQNGTNLYIKS